MTPTNATRRRRATRGRARNGVAGLLVVGPVAGYLLVADYVGLPAVVELGLAVVAAVVMTVGALLYVPGSSGGRRA